MIQQIMPADGWFFHHELIDGDYALYPLAAWGLSSEGKVIGLVAEATSSCAPTLKDVSNVKGRYVFKDKLSREDKNHYMSGI